MKKELRKILLQKREKITKSRRHSAQKQSFEKLQDILSEFSKILSFASFSSEIDLWPLNRYLRDKRKLFLPKVEGNHLHVYQVEDFSHLKRSSLGVLEPDLLNTKKISSLNEISCVLVPGLGFDANNYRIGYGKGFYDRLLFKMSESSKVGIGYKEQLVDELYKENHDQALSSVYLF